MEDHAYSVQHFRNSINRKLKNLNLLGLNNKYAGLIPVKLFAEKFYQAAMYCDENFGDNWIWGNPDKNNLCVFYFLYEEDAIQFKLSL